VVLFAGEKLVLRIENAIEAGLLAFLGFHFDLVARLYVEMRGRGEMICPSLSMGGDIHGTMRCKLCL
jgi:hypothetical protein